MWEQNPKTARSITNSSSRRIRTHQTNTLTLLRNKQGEGQVQSNDLYQNGLGAVPMRSINGPAERA